MSAREYSSPIEILLVEDNPGDVRLTQETLSDSKIRHRLRVARDGVEALDVLRREGAHANAPRPNLILLDLNLPMKSGLEVLAEVKSDRALRPIPVIVLTTSGAEKDIVQAYDLNANCYVTKPLDLDRFEEVVRSIENFWFRLAQLPKH